MWQLRYTYKSKPRRKHGYKGNPEANYAAGDVVTGFILKWARSGQVKGKSTT